VGEHDHDEAGPRQVEDPFGDQLEGIHVVVAQQLVRDRRRRCGPLLATGALLEQPGMRDRDARGRGQRLDEHLVLRGERTCPGVGQVEVAVDLVANPQRHPQEAADAGVVSRHPDRAGVLGEHVETDRARVVDQRPQQAAALRGRPDPGDGLGVHPGVDELVQAAVVAQHPDRAVRGAHQLDSGLDDLSQRQRQVQVLHSQAVCLQQSTQLDVRRPAQLTRGDRRHRVTTIRTMTIDMTASPGRSAHLAGHRGP